MDCDPKFDSYHKTVGAMALFYIFSAIFFLVYGIYYFSKRKFNYWKDQNVPQLEPLPIFGNYKDFILMKTNNGENAVKICEKFPNEPYIGTFYGTEPALLIKSPELIKLVTTKDFYYFSAREISKYTTKDHTAINLFFTDGDRWKVVRQNTTPLFSSAKMKTMFHLIEKCAHQFQDVIDKESKSKSVEVKSLSARFTMDVIGSCAFGVDTNVMTKAEGNPFKTIGDSIFDFSILRTIRATCRTIWPAIFYGLQLQFFPAQIEKFFNHLMTNVFKARNYEPSGRKDFVDLMLDLKKNNYITGDSITNLKTGKDDKVSLKVDDDFVVAQSLLFFGAGYETTATTTSFTLYELAKNEEAQKKVLKEVDEYMVRHKNKLEYECISELPFLEACVDETLRLYPVLGLITREVVEDYTLPSGVVLKKGVRVHLPVYHFHHNAEYFPEPEKFRPERFYGEEKRNIIPYTYMPFGEGPRICIGMRFARMSFMAALITILKGYSVELAEGMPRSVQFEPRSIVTTAIGGIYLRFVPRPGSEKRVYSS